MCHSRRNEPVARWKQAAARGTAYDIKLRTLYLAKLTDYIHMSFNFLNFNLVQHIEILIMYQLSFQFLFRSSYNI